MTKTFANYGALTSELAFDLIDTINAHDFGDLEISVEYGASNVSCSAYVEFAAYDEEDEEVADVKVRFSDHADRYGSNISLQINDLIEVIEDDGEYIETRISEDDYNSLLTEAFEFILEKTKR